MNAMAEALEHADVLHLRSQLEQLSTLCDKLQTENHDLRNEVCALRLTNGALSTKLSGLRDLHAEAVRNYSALHTECEELRGQIQNARSIPAALSAEKG